MSDIIVVDCECPSCDGTGAYSGFGEGKNSAVVCSRCGGTGRSKISFTPFTGRKRRKEIKWIYKCNPGIGLSSERPERFGGMSYEDWLAGKDFPDRSENREFTCPCWWYQTEDYKRKPDWEECVGGGGSFLNCKHFCNKNKCWERWDRENRK